MALEQSANGRPPPATRRIAGAALATLERELAQIRRKSCGGIAHDWPFPIGLRDYVPEDIGEGWWDFIRLSNQLMIYSAETTYREDTWIDNPGDRWFKIRIVLSGSLLAADRSLLLKGSSAHLEVFPGKVAGGFFVKGGETLRLVGLICQPEILTQTLALNPACIPHPLDILTQCAFGAPERATVSLTAEVLHSANDILRAQSRLPKELRRAYLEAKGLEVLCIVLAQLSQESPPTDSPAVKISLRDLRRLHEARDILNEQYQSPPTIAQLAKKVGLNQTKLKSGFKMVFGSTISKTIEKNRMEAAVTLLVHTSLNISEISYRVGYEYAANFTCAFKRVYGYLPSDVCRPDIRSVMAGGERQNDGEMAIPVGDGFGGRH